MATPSTSRGRQPGARVGPAPRQPKKVLCEIGFLSLLITYGGAVVTYVAIGASDFPALIRWAEGSGEALRDQLGWALAADVTVLLAFYAAVLGGQIFGSETYAARTRRILGLAAELIAASVVPALLVVFIYCTAHTAQWSILFVLVPVSATIWFLGVQIGAFILFEPELRRTMAEESLVWTSKQLKALGHHSRRPIWAVLPLNAAAVAALASAVVFSTHRFWVGVASWFLLFLAALVLLGLNTYTVYDTKTSSGGFSRSMSWLLPVFFTVLGVAIGIGVAYQHNGYDGLAISLVPILALVLTIWPRAVRNTPLLQWSIQGVANRIAARTLGNRRRKALDELKELEPEEAPALPTTRQRILTALRHALEVRPVGTALPSSNRPS